MHFALIRFSSLGDVVLQSSMVSWIKFLSPNSKITFITSKSFEPLVVGHKHIDDVIGIDKLSGKSDLIQLTALGKRLNNELKVDLIIDLHGTLRATILKFVCYKIPALTVNKRTVLRKILVIFKKDFLKSLGAHVERNISDFSFLFRHNFDETELRKYLAKETQRDSIGLTTLPWSFNQFTSSVAGKYIVISPVASFPTKRWPIENVNHLLELMTKNPMTKNLKVVIVAGPTDKYCEGIKNQKFEATGALINLQGKTSIEESAKLLAGAELVVTNDTGSAHMSEAFGTTTIVTYGATSPSFGFKPHLESSVFISHNVGCNPCSATGSRPCFKNELECMMAIKPQEVFEKIIEIIQGRK